MDNRNADIRALGAVIYRMLTGHPPMYREARALGLMDPSGRWVWLELAAVIDRVNGSGEAGCPVGQRVTQEPDCTGLKARWHRRARDEAAWLGVASNGTTLDEALPGSGHADGLADPAPHRAWRLPATRGQAPGDRAQRGWPRLRARG